MFWPSFNGALALESQQHRVVINTVLALSASCISAFIFDSMMRPHRKFDMVSIQNATLAGGVAVGSSSDLVIEPWGALFIGSIAGFISVFGYIYISPYLSKKFGLDDTCGVHNLHGIPGIIGAIGGAISAATAGDNAYGVTIATVFPRRAPANPADDNIEPGDGLSASQQAQIQVAALFITLAFATIGGTLVGMVVKAPWFLPPSPNKPSILEYGKSSDERHWFKDEMYWEVPTDEGDAEEDEEQVKNDRMFELEMLAIDIKKKEEKKQALEKILGNTSSEVDTVIDGV
jgi:ammonium transporter Rh